MLVPEGCVSLPEECVLVPEGCVLLPEGCVLLPKGCVSLPEECVLLPEGCPPQCCDLTAADGRMCVLKGSRKEIKVKCSFSLCGAASLALLQVCSNCSEYQDINTDSPI